MPPYVSSTSGAIAGYRRNAARDDSPADSIEHDRVVSHSKGVLVNFGDSRVDVVSMPVLRGKITGGGCRNCVVRPSLLRFKGGRVYRVKGGGENVGTTCCMLCMFVGVQGETLKLTGLSIARSAAVSGRMRDRGFRCAVAIARAVETINVAFRFLGFPRYPPSSKRTLRSPLFVVVV